MSLGDELHALGSHLIKTPVENAFLHLEFRNAVTKQAANAISFFVNRYPVPGAIQLLRRCQPCRA